MLHSSGSVGGLTPFKLTAIKHSQAPNGAKFRRADLVSCVNSVCSQTWFSNKKPAKNVQLVGDKEQTKRIRWIRLNTKNVELCYMVRAGAVNLIHPINPVETVFVPPAQIDPLRNFKVRESRRKRVERKRARRQRHSIVRDAMDVRLMSFAWQVPISPSRAALMKPVHSDQAKENLESNE